MAGNKLYICLETKTRGKSKRKNYFIFSVKLSDLTTQLPNAPDFKLQQNFHAPPSMGCGRFESKIVFAGGMSTKHTALITLDLTTQELSYNSFPPMKAPKVKPLVFELKKRLYVMDIISGYRERAIEYFYFPENIWHQLPLPEQDFILRHHLEEHEKDSRNYSFVVMGNTCCLDVPPLSGAYYHHPTYTYKAWQTFYTNHPFSGVATCYRQDGFDDSVIISLDNGLIRAHQFRVHEGYWRKPVELYKVEPSCDSQEDMSGYFADFECGIFSLSVSDKLSFYVYTFEFSIIGTESDGTLKVNFNLLTHYRIKFDRLPLTDNNIPRIVGCFASSPNHQAIKSADEAINNYMSRYGYVSRCDDDPGMFEFEGSRYSVPKEVKDISSLISIRDVIGW